MHTFIGKPMNWMHWDVEESIGLCHKLQGTIITIAHCLKIAAVSASLAQMLYLQLPAMVWWCARQALRCGPKAR